MKVKILKNIIAVQENQYASFTKGVICAVSISYNVYSKGREVPLLCLKEATTERMQCINKHTFRKWLKEGKIAIIG
jgi:hypothetical protein